LGISEHIVIINGLHLERQCSILYLLQIAPEQLNIYYLQGLHTHMDWKSIKSIIRVSLKLFAFLCGLLFALPLGLLLWGMYAVVHWIWRLAQRRTSDACSKASTRLSAESAEQHEEVTPMASMPTQEAPGVPLPEPPASKPVHQPPSLSVSPENLVTFIVDLDALRAAAGVTFSSRQIGQLYRVYERSLQELAELREMAESKKKSEAGE